MTFWKNMRFLTYLDQWIFKLVNVKIAFHKNHFWKMTFWKNMWFLTYLDQWIFKLVNVKICFLTYIKLVWNNFYYFLVNFLKKIHF